MFNRVPSDPVARVRFETFSYFVRYGAYVLLDALSHGGLSERRRVAWSTHSGLYF